MSNLEKYNKIFCSVFCVDENVLDDKFNFKQIAIWDSVAHMMLITQLEETFDIMLETDDILHFGGYMNGIRILKRYGVVI